MEYTYDDLNQLTAASYSDGRTESYTYDASGNLLTFQSGTTTHTYTYGDSDWIDLLTAVDGVALTYDAIGNPLSYYNGQNYTMTWTEGRKLASVTTADGTTSYLYNADGIRFKKINPDGSYILYMTTEGAIIGEKHYTSEHVLTKNLRYTFDENGAVCGYSTSTDGTTWTDYCFIRNLQGDVLQVFRESDTVIVAEYSYDSWGNILSATGEKAEENPFRYRGYYYDGESGFYYLQSRYYDPEIGRFINADDISYLGTDGSMLSYNLFAYCKNNPINESDFSGNFSWKNVFKVATIVTVVALGVAAIALSGGAAAPPLLAATSAMAGTTVSAGAVASVAIGVATTGLVTMGASATASICEMASNNSSQGNRYDGRSTYNKDGERIDYEYYGNGNGNVHYDGTKGKVTLWRLENGIEKVYNVSKPVGKIIGVPTVQRAIARAIEIVRSLAGTK